MYHIGQGRCVEVVNARKKMIKSKRTRRDMKQRGGLQRRAPMLKVCYGTEYSDSFYEQTMLKRKKREQYFSRACVHRLHSCLPAKSDADANTGITTTVFLFPFFISKERDGRILVIPTMASLIRRMYSSPLPHSHQGEPGGHGEGELSSPPPRPSGTGPSGGLPWPPDSHQSIHCLILLLLCDITSHVL